MDSSVSREPPFTYSFADFEDLKFPIDEDSLPLSYYLNGHAGHGKGAFDIASEYINNLPSELVSIDSSSITMDSTVNVKSSRNLREGRKRDSLNQHSLRLRESSRCIKAPLTEKSSNATTENGVIKQSNKLNRISKGKLQTSNSSPVKQPTNVRRYRVNKTSNLEQADTNSNSLVNVHRLINSACVAGRSLLENKGKLNANDLTLLTKMICSPDAAQSERESVSQKENFTPTQSPPQTNNPSTDLHSPTDCKHPFIHHWEYDDELIRDRFWHSKRAKYLKSEPFICESSTATVIQSSPSIEKVVVHPDKCSVKSSSSKRRLSRESTLGQQTIPSDDQHRLEPCVLGYRWPDSLSLSDYELMLLWN